MPDPKLVPRVIMGRQFLNALRDAGIVRKGEHIRRVVIDAPVNDPVVVYVERGGDERLLGVVQTLNGIEVTRDATDAR